MTNPSRPPELRSDPVGSMKNRVEKLVPEGDRIPASVWVEDALKEMEDPLAKLPPTAQRLVAGAMEVVVSKGFAKLTLANISAASGENVAAVKYYFGNKAGLVSVLLDAVLYAELRPLTGSDVVAPEDTGLSRLAYETMLLSDPIEPVRVVFEMLPHAVRDEKLRQQLCRYYATFFALHLAQVGVGGETDPERRARLSGLAVLLSAVADGLTVQALIGPEHFDPRQAFNAFDLLLRGGLPALLDDGIGQQTTAEDAPPTGSQP